MLVRSILHKPAGDFKRFLGVLRAHPRSLGNPGCAGVLTSKTRRTKGRNKACRVVTGELSNRTPYLENGRYRGKFRHAGDPEIKARKVSKVGLKMSATEPDAAVPKARGLRNGSR